MEHWDELVDGHRHFGMFWLPTEESGALYNLDGHGERLADQCYVKVYDEVGPDVPDDDTVGRRVDRCYRIFPMVYDPNFHELEYFVALDRATEALHAMRELMQRSLPDSVYPLEVRTVGADEAFLSPQFRTPTVVISVSGTPGTDYWRYLRSVDELLAGFDARVHWGKLHFMTPERLHESTRGRTTSSPSAGRAGPARHVPQRPPAAAVRVARATPARRTTRSRVTTTIHACRRRTSRGCGRATRRR